MSRPVDLDRTLELEPEPVDDLAPLESTSAGPTVPRQDRIQTVSRPLTLESRPPVVAREHERELESHRLSLERREQRHRHAIELAEQRSRHELLKSGRHHEGRMLVAMMGLVVASGLAWITMPDTEAAQIVFTTGFGAVAGYLGGRSQRRDP